MVIERLPELAKLTDDECAMLALELLETVRVRQRVDRVSPEWITEFEARRAILLKEVETTKTWPQVKADLLAKYWSR